MTTEPVNFLIVDDLEENLLSLEGLLRRDGLRFLRARTGDEALELLLKYDVALALLDVQMPGMDGFQLAEFMRGNARTRRIPIIFLTAGVADAQRRFRGYEAGAVDFIQKPIEPDILRSKADVFFELHEQRRQIEAQRDALEAYAETLKTADRHKNQFLAVLGHELRNPLMAFSGGLQMLKRHPDSDRNEEIHRQLERHVLHVSRLVEDLLDISRIDQGKISLRKEPVELGAVLKNSVEASQPQIDAGGHTLVVAACPDDVRLYADPIRLAQVISNLLNNAACYTPKGGRIELCARAGGQTVDIAVSDNGVGIPDDMKAQIFDIFVQAPDRVANHKDGLGIGLALVQQLVELHDGSISVESAGANQCSRFTVRLPRWRGAVGEMDPAAPSSA